MRDYTGQVDPNLVIPKYYLLEELPDDPGMVDIETENISSECIADAKDDEVRARDDNDVDTIPKAGIKTLSSVQLQAEDYGGSIALPHYGFRRPSADYFNSNLMCYNFVIADISGRMNNVYFYDERSQGKGADALCSLRIRYHLKKREQFQEHGVTPQLCMSLLDNCVGQNKSQLVMKFNCLLSLLFYDHVALLYFLPKHCHMIPDRVVAHCKIAIKGFNLFTIGQITELCNRVKGINSEWLQPDDSDVPFRVEWGTFLNKFFKNLPVGYTNNYFFEFSQGFVTFRRMGTSPDAETTSVRLIEVTPAIRKTLRTELFGNQDGSTITMRDLTLPKHAGKTLTKKKLESLSKKYFSIPKKYLKYYPKFEGPVKDLNSVNSKKANVKKRKLEKLDPNKISSKRRVGRPKKIPLPIIGVNSITKFFRPV